MYVPSRGAAILYPLIKSYPMYLDADEYDAAVSIG